MHVRRSRARRAMLSIMVVGLLAASAANHASAEVSVTRVFLPGFAAPGTPEPFRPPRSSKLPPELDLNQVGIIKVGPETARNVLVLVPYLGFLAEGGTSHLVPVAPGFNPGAEAKRINEFAARADRNRAAMTGV